jgi:glycosyltransferase EpsF
MIAEPKRVLHVVSAMERGGAETLLMNVYRNVDRSKIQFDFVTHRNESCDYDEEISTLGGKIYRISSLGQMGPMGYIKQLKKIMSANDYAAVHSHTDYQCGFPALAAKLSGIKRRICHSHSNHFPKGNGLKERTVLKMLRSMIRYSATDYCACSTEAAQFLFGQSLVKNDKIHLLRNGIEVRQFTNMDLDCKKSVKKELNIPGESKIIGHIGRFSRSKNHPFLLKVLKKLLEERKDIVAILAGDGPLRKATEEEAKKLGIIDHIRFLGVRADIPRLMNAMDVFVFPSIHEGFGIVTVEAQCSATPCVVSDGVPKNTDMGLGLMSFVSLNANLSHWSKEIENALMKKKPSKKLIINNISRLGFDIHSSIPEWLELYG